MGEENSYEREFKFSGVELESLRERLAELEAERTGPAAFEDNWVFDRNQELHSAGCVLRLRVDAGGAQLTFKGPARFEGGLKVRLEHQTRLEDSDQMRALLEALGYQVVRRYQKMREEWRLGGVTVSLDRLPIGDFAEFEGDGCERVARRCGFEPESAEKRSYLQLYEEFKEENPEAPPDMEFP